MTFREVALGLGIEPELFTASCASVAYVQAGHVAREEFPCEMLVRDINDNIMFSAIALLPEQAERLHRDRKTWLLVAGFIAGDV